MIEYDRIERRVSYEDAQFGIVILTCIDYTIMAKVSENLMANSTRKQKSHSNVKYDRFLE